MNRRQRVRRDRRRKAHNQHLKAYHEALARRERVLADLERMSKPELIDYADKSGWVIPKSWRKGQILDSIKEKISALPLKVAA